MNAYLDLVRYLLILFFFLTVFSMPSMIIYQKYGAIRNDPMGVLS